jgi:hypothetical protein
MYPFFSTTKPGFAMVEMTSAKQINTWLPTNPGEKEAACTYARCLSELTDWPQFETLSQRQKEGVRVRVHELLSATIASYSSGDEER